jgi:superfamily II DNA helicase RecQ
MRLGISSPSLTTPPAKKKRAPAKKKRAPAKKKRAPVKKKRAPSLTTPPAKKTPPKREGDKCELSPNNRAKCTECKRKILQGVTRFGVEEYSPRYSKYMHRYYHDRCLSEAAKKKLQLAAGSPEKEIALQRKEKVTKDNLVRQRSDLRESLRRLRLVFANRLDVQAFMIFSDAILDELVAKMPKNKTEILRISGIKEKKYASFGEPIISVVTQYHRRYNRSDKPAPKAPRSVVQSRAPTKVNSNDDVEVGESLSCEEIVQRKFEHASANGYVISID